MLKKVAFLISFVMILSLSFVFATEENQDILLIAPAPSDEVVDTTDDTPISGEIVSEEVIEDTTDVSEEITNDVSDEAASDETLSGEIEDDNTTTDDTNTNNTTTDIAEDENDNESEQGSTVAGAIIAIVIVVAVVAIVAVIQKK